MGMRVAGRGRGGLAGGANRLFDRAIRRARLRRVERGISVIVLRPIVARAAALGADAAALRDALGFDDDTSEDAFIPAERVARCLQQAATKTGEAFPLLLVAGAPVGSFGLLDYLLMASKTLREALARAARFYALASQLVTLHVREEGDDAVVAHRLLPGITRVPALTEFAFAALVERMRLAVPSASLERISFSHHKADPTPFAGYFGCCVQFGADVDEVRFDRAALDAPFATADATTSAFLEAQAERLLRSSAPLDDDDVMARARDLVRATLREGSQPTIEALARKLGRSQRTLQRELLAAKTSHRQLVADVRKERALELLARRDVSLIEVALELGFADQASFQRAFKRWTGRTPGELRRRE